jgi:hypothetical protein
MSLTQQPSPESLIASYLRSKDENRPYRMPAVFAPDARLEMAVRTSTISFPAAANGLEGVTEVLIREFNRSYENIHTFCLQRPPSVVSEFACDWMVAMSEKATRSVRVGCGRYDWRFRPTAPHLVSHFVITIETMTVLPAEVLTPVMAWVTALPYPWCPSATLLGCAPPIAALDPVLRYVSTVAAARGV